jgi:hypothetical protein
MEREEAFSMPESIISMEDDTIRVGQLVYSGNLFSQEYGIITAIHGEQTHPQGFGLVLNTTKMAELDMVFSSGERSYHVPENVIRHLPWKLFGNIFSASEIENAIHFAEARDQRKAIGAVTGGIPAIAGCCRRNRPQKTRGQKHAHSAQAIQGLQVFREDRRQLNPSLMDGWPDCPASK